METNKPDSLTYRLTAVRDRLATNLTGRFELQTYSVLTIVKLVKS